MIYYERIHKLSTIFILSFVVFFIITIISIFNTGFIETFQYNFANDLRGALFTLFLILLTIFTLVIGVTLKYIVKDANEEMNLLELRMKKENK